MRITEVQIIPIKPKDGLVAMASIVFDDVLYLGSIGIHTRRDGSGFRITYPTKKLGQKDFNIYHPINRQVGQIIEEAILARATEVLNGPERSNDYVRHSNSYNP